jgi:hypothetical protein
MANVHTVSDFKLNLLMDNMAKSCPELRGAENKTGELAVYIDPIVYWADFRVDVCDEGRVILGDGLLTIHSFYAARGLSGCQSATLMAATIGDAIPRYSEMCIREGRLWEGTVADLLGSYAVEAVVEEFHRSLWLKYRPSRLYPSPRFSPGYGDWSLKDQSRIVSLLAADPRITVGPGCLLEPVKSVTALVGWSDEQKAGEYPVGDKGRGLCQGTGSCSSCSTWACLKKGSGTGK